MEWLSKLCSASDHLELLTIGKSDNGRKIEMVIATTDGKFDYPSLRASPKPLLLIQAGIHAGEIDGKDAGMMLLRDLAFGKKKDLLKQVNILFIPILNVDGHERTSPYNRVNQRGPENMGWRTNARNLNLNRDYSKLDAAETRAVVKVMTDFSPSLYLDLHVTDGADYQYDITYGYSSYSTAIASWLDRKFSPAINSGLKDAGHIPGPLMFAANDRDFSEGNTEFPYSPRFSNSYGDLRRLPSVLVENHSLKPFKQRVLGTYVFLENVLRILAKDGAELRQAIDKDKSVRNREITLTWTRAAKPDSMQLLGIESKLMKSTLTNGDYVVWTGKPKTSRISFQRYTQPGEKALRPKAYWIPASYPEVIARLASHGIEMEGLTTAKTLTVSMYRLHDHQFSSSPFEGHFTLKTKSRAEQHEETFFPGAVRISTDQPLGDLVVFLLDPNSPDSFLQWGFFPEIFTQTEYIEEYAIEPLAKLMLSKDENLRKEFELKKQQEPAFASDKQAIYAWFYQRSAFVDQRYLLYPVGIEQN